MDGNRLYALTENGDLASLSTEDGSVVWKRNILTEFDGGNPRWRISESPLVDGERLIVTPGGSDAGVVALDKRTGQTLWTSAGLSDPAGYSSCLAVEVPPKVFCELLGIRMCPVDHNDVGPES